VHALSTVAKLIELRDCCQEVLDGSYPRATLDPAIEEVAEALETDFIAARIVKGKGIDPKTILPRPDASTEELQSTTILWLDLIRPSYSREIEKEAIELLCKNERNFRLMVVAKLFVADLLQRGFHRRFILDTTEANFFTSRIGRCTEPLIRRFFEAFNENKEKYCILMQGPRPVVDAIADGKSLFSILNEDHLRNLVEMETPAATGISEDRPALVFRELEARDPFSAVEIISSLLSLAPAFNVVYPSVERPEIDDECLVINRKSGQEFRVSKAEILAPAHSYTSRIE
jgi:hypothetical protein